MIRAVLDTNVVVSGVFGLDRERSTPGAILRAWHRRLFELVTTDPLIAEVERALTNPFFAPRLPVGLADRTVLSLREDATRVDLVAEVIGVATHPEDDLVLAAAASAGADYLVTGDLQLQRLGTHQGVTILGPRHFLTLLERQGTDGVDAEG